MRNRILLFLLAPIFCLSSCGVLDDGALEAVVIDTEENLLNSGLRLSPGAQHVRSATQSGLVSLNAQGEVVPALAEAWLPTDDGRSIIFRLRDDSWPDGTPMDAESARVALLRAIADLEGTSLALDLANIKEVRAMAGRVIEVRLASAEPFFLTLLAQPELALRHSGGGTGPMVATQNDGITQFDFRPPGDRGLPIDENWQDDVREIRLRTADADDAIAMFLDGDVALVLNGDLGNLPLVETGPLSSGTLRIDATFGLFGLMVQADEGLLGNQDVREGLAMAIDRTALLSRYNVDGWIPTTRPVSPGLPGETGLVAERWEGQEIAQRREEAAARIAAWQSQFGQGDRSQAALVSIYLPEGRGWDILFDDLSRQFGAIGISLQREQESRSADLRLVDRVARYPGPRWFLNQFNCSIRAGLCNEVVDRRVAEALDEQNPSIRAAMLAQAEADLTLDNTYIPFGSPLRWSLVRGSVDGFAGNPYAFHPLPDMAERPR